MPAIGPVIDVALFAAASVAAGVISARVVSALNESKEYPFGSAAFTSSLAGGIGGPGAYLVVDFGVADCEVANLGSFEEGIWPYLSVAAGVATVTSILRWFIADERKPSAAAVTPSVTYVPLRDGGAVVATIAF